METAPIIRHPRRALRPLAGRKGSTAKPAKKRTAGTHRNGFLNHSFAPFYGVAFRDWRTAEQEFFISVENLCNLYRWTKPDVSGLSFPQNIREAYQKLNAKKAKGFDLEIKIGQDAQHACCLATAKAFDVSYQLYYIPVRPLWKMHQNKQEQPLYRLIRIVFAYFYQVAGVPFFNEPGTIDGNYDTIKNWIEEEQDDEKETYRQQQKKELKELEKAGAVLLPEVKKQFSRIELETALVNYRKTADCDTHLMEVIEELLKLIKDYPKRAIKETMSYEAETDDNNTLYWEQYISFYWSGEDCLWETLYQMVNDEFQEMAYQEEPVSLQWFDTPQKKAEHIFDFEPRLFALINRLSELLSDYDYEEPNA